MNEVPNRFRGGLAAAALCAGLLLAGAGPVVEPGEELSGGETTVFDRSPNAFGRALANLERSRWFPLREGKELFVLDWLAPGDAAEGHPRRGLGPRYEATSCASCHFKDGRGRTPDDARAGEPVHVLHLSAPSPDEDAALRPEPTYGRQLATRSIPDEVPEGRLTVTWEEIEGRFADGTPYRLRRPVAHVADLADGPFAPGTLTSLRTPPPILGMGLLEAIPEEAILARADPNDENGDGLSGRANRVPDLRRGGTALGRFGWKAGQPDLEHQVAAALLEDLGVSSPLHPPGSEDGEPEADEHRLGRLVLYARLLAVPARRDWREPEVLRGRELFRRTGCAGCHHPRWTTGTVEDVPELSGQTVRPYTDLLLHDMGPGLADGRPEHEATGSEWRTPPLWGLGLLGVVTGSDGAATLLHDGRARTPEEAILWHGGEAEASRERFRHLPAADRAALLRFLASL